MLKFIGTLLGFGAGTLVGAIVGKGKEKKAIRLPSAADQEVTLKALSNAGISAEALTILDHNGNGSVGVLVNWDDLAMALKLTRTAMSV